MNNTDKHHYMEFQSDDFSGKSSLLDELIDDTLKEEPLYSLPDDFADKVTRMVDRKVFLRKKIYELLFYAASIIVLLAIAGILMYFVDPEFLKSILNFLLVSKWFVIIGLISFSGIQTADHLLVKPNEKLIF
ncbi:MAG: hypothetical protein KAU83_10680 [Bacteroidales bacterium]|nr:hypothetical protein [Bacteroidales bacterium]